MMQCKAGLDAVCDRGSLKKVCALQTFISRESDWRAVKNAADFPEPFVSMDPDLSEC